MTHQVGLCLSGADYVVSVRCGLVEPALPVKDTSLIDLEDTSPGSPVAEQRRKSRYEDDRYNLSSSKLGLESTSTEGNKAKKLRREIYTRESREIGKVSTTHYSLVLFAAGGTCYWLIFVVLILLVRAIDVGRNYLLQEWTDDFDDTRLLHYIGLYVGSIALGSLADSFQWVWLYGLGGVGMYNRACKVIHDALISKIAGAPLGFFDRTPKGRLLNVLSKDVTTVDQQSADAVGRECICLRPRDFPSRHSVISDSILIQHQAP